MSELKESVLRVLLVEDSEDDAALVLRALRRGGYAVHSERVQEREELRRALARSAWDLVLADYDMPRFTGLEALKVVQESGCDLPFIIVSGTIGEEVAVEAMRAGAHDYVMKNNLTRLVPAIQRELREAEERRGRRIAEETLRHQAYHDILTGLPNRWLLQDRVAQAIALARRESRGVTLLFIDLDRFKSVNDSLGHLVGDQLLRATASRLLSLARDGDTLARLGGDDFALVLADTADAAVAADMAGAVRDQLLQPFVLSGLDVHVGASIGIARFPEDGADAETLLKHAEFAMYHAKQEGRGNFQFYTADIHAAAHERFTLEHDLHRAVRDGELVLYYQPQVDLETQAVVGVEALLRWKHPQRGMIGPDKFIPVAEETGLIIAIGEWVVRAAVADYGRWQQLGCAPARLALNLSATQLHHRGLVPMLQQVLAESAVAPAVLEFEITESGIMVDPARAVEAVQSIKTLGASVAIDDFGTGYSSLAYLKQFPVDVLKIDRSFVRDIETDRDDAAIVETIIGMARTLDLKVIAEGVEQPAQAEFLRSRGCRWVQGFLLGRPMPFPQLSDLLGCSPPPTG